MLWCKIIFIIFLINFLRYSYKYDRYLKQNYPEEVDNIWKNHPCSINKMNPINPLYSFSILEGIPVKDEKLRVFRRNSLFSFACSIFFIILNGFLAVIY